MASLPSSLWNSSARQGRIAEPLAEAEPLVLAYRRREEEAATTEPTPRPRPMLQPTAAVPVMPAIILRIPDLDAQETVVPSTGSAVTGIQNYLFWGGCAVAVLITGVLLLGGKKSQPDSSESAPQWNAATSIPKANLSAAPGAGPGAGHEQHQPVPTWKVPLPKATAGKATAVVEPGETSVGIESAAVQSGNSTARLPEAHFGQSGPQMDQRGMTQNTQGVLPWRNNGPVAPNEAGPQLGPPDQGSYGPQQGPFSLPPDESGWSERSPWPRPEGNSAQRPQGPNYRTSALPDNRSSGASFEGMIVKPPLEPTYDSSRPRPY